MSLQVIFVPEQHNSEYNKNKARMKSLQWRLCAKNWTPLNVS